MGEYNLHNIVRKMDTPQKQSTFTITGTVLKKIVPSLSLQAAGHWADLLTKLCPQYNVNTNERFAEFIAHVAVESKYFTAKVESLYYNFPNIWNTFKKYFRDEEHSKEYTKNSQKLGNLVYANRMGNGSVESGDGYNFRGGGCMSITGRDMYVLYAKHIGKSLAEATNLVRTDDEHALRSALWFFDIVKNLEGLADAPGFSLEIQKKINGGMNGHPERLVVYNRAKQVLST